MLPHGYENCEHCRKKYYKLMRVIHIFQQKSQSSYPHEEIKKASYCLNNIIVFFKIIINSLFLLLFIYSVCQFLTFFLMFTEDLKFNTSRMNYIYLGKYFINTGKKYMGKNMFH